jgi:uncharacterized protein
MALKKGAHVTAITVERNLVIPLADGTALAGDLYRPAGDHPHPVLLNFYPYRKDDIIGSLFDGTRRRFVERGYADLLVDMRGTGGSDGNYGETFNLKREGRDAAEVVEWAAAQDWCDGNVGVWGVSYGGFMAFASACEKPPHLKAIVSVYATTDNRERLAPHGCPAWFGMYAWAAHMLAMDLLPPTYEDGEGRWRRTWEQRLRRMEGELPHGLEWQVHPPDDVYWSEARLDPASIEVPTLLVAGWRDIFTDEMVELFGSLPGRRHLVIGPWLHVVPHLSEVEPWDWVGAMSDWWDQYLVPGGQDGRTGASVVYFAQGANTWYSDECWPPTGTAEKQLHLAGRRLESEAQPDIEIHPYTGDPTVGVAAGILDPFGTGLGWPEDQGVDDVRSLTFTTGPLGMPLEIAGRPAADLFVLIDNGVEAQLSVKLSAVGPDGRSHLITSGIERCAPAALVTSDRQSNPGYPPAGEVVPLTVQLAATDYVVAAGHSLRLAVAAADSPTFWPSPSVAQITLFCGGEMPSVLRLPVAPNVESTGRSPVQVARPPAEPDPGWAQFGKPSYRLQHDRVNGEMTVSLGLRSQVKTPLGAVVSNNEMFSAHVEPRRPDAARLDGRSLFEIDMPGGERVVVRTEASYGRQASVCHGSVLCDGVLVFDHHWSNIP